MTPAEAMLMAERVARRLTKDTGIASAEDYVSVAALAILDAQDKPEAVQWTVAKRAIIDEHRRIHGRKGSPRREAGRQVELLGERDALLQGLDEMTEPERVRLAILLHDSLPTASLSPRELAVLTHLAQGLTRQQAALADGVSPETARTQVRSAMRKLGVHTAAHAVARAIYLGYLAPDIGR